MFHGGAEACFIGRREAYSWGGRLGVCFTVCSEGVLNRGRGGWGRASRVAAEACFTEGGGRESRGSRGVFHGAQRGAGACFIERRTRASRGVADIFLTQEVEACFMGGKAHFWQGRGGELPALLCLYSLRGGCEKYVTKFSWGGGRGRGRGQEGGAVSPFPPVPAFWSRRDCCILTVGKKKTMFLLSRFLHVSICFFPSSILIFSPPLPSLPPRPRPSL